MTGDPVNSVGGPAASGQDGAWAARRLWERLEPIHAVTYFTDESATAARAAGLRGFWMAYFACRLAPLGPVGPMTATAACFGFHRSRTERALPDAWQFATPAQALKARLEGATLALRRITGVAAPFTRGVTAAAELAWAAAQQADISGRILGAANQALPRPDDPLAVVWQAATTLREHRGDGHNAVLITAGLTPVQAHWLKIGAAETDPETLRASRNWPAAAWDSGRADLIERGWLDAHGLLTAAGRGAHDDIEAQTDAAAATPWTGIGPEDTTRLAALLKPLSAAIVASGAVPFPNPIGLPRADSRRAAPEGQ